jgi:hypothetical protein
MQSLNRRRPLSRKPLGDRAREADPALMVRLYRVEDVGLAVKGADAVITGRGALDPDMHPLIPQTLRHPFVCDLVETSPVQVTTQAVHLFPGSRRTHHPGCLGTLYVMYTSAGLGDKRGASRVDS